MKGSGSMLLTNGSGYIRVPITQKSLDPDHNLMNLRIQNAAFNSVVQSGIESGLNKYR